MKKKLRWIWETFFAPSPLRRKFLRTFLVVGLVPLLLMGLVTVYLLNLIHRLDIAALEKNLAEQTSLEIKKFVDAVVENVNLEVTTPTFLSVAEENFILERLLDRNRALIELTFFCNAPEHCRVGYPTSERTREGSKGTFSNADYREAPFFTTASQGNTYLGPVGRGDTPPTAEVSGPVINKNRAVIAVLAGRFTLEAIEAIVERNKLGSSGYVYVVDERGSIIAHPQKRWVGTNVSQLAAKNRGVDPGVAGGAPENDIYTSLDGRTVSGILASVPDLGWGVVAEWPRAETQSVVVGMIWNVTRFSVGSLLLILVIGGFMTSSLIKPISILKQGVQAIGQGNFNYRFDLKTRDELEELGARLNVMAADLKNLQELHELQVRTQTLSESLRKEQELSGLKDQFVRTVSHQFNTPLSVIHWALEMIGAPEASMQTVRDGLRSINQSRKDILSMVDDLFTLSEIGFQYRKGNVKVVDFRKLVGDATSKLHEDITQKNLTITFTEGNSELTAKANEFAMSKVVEHLMTNAVTYSHDKGKIEVSLTADQKKLTFRVADQGIGIPEEDQKSIFGQFFRASNAIQKKNVGTGVGLFIAKTIVDGHGGKIWFESKKDQGAVFYFVIPREG